MGATDRQSGMLSLAPTGRFHARGPQHLAAIGDRFGISSDELEAVRLHSMVLPFRVNDYVLEELIDWSAVPEDPIYRLVFPQRGMLTTEAHRRLAGTLDGGRATAETAAVIHDLRAELNPHPAQQQQLNVPEQDGHALPGVQHKYAETALYFPSQGQTCHAYCTYCFRWAQFLGDVDLRFATPHPDEFVAYLGHHPEVSDVLVTGGDPLVMSTARLREHLGPLLTVPTVQTIRFGTKSISYWPQRFVTDSDADELLRLFEQIVSSGRTMAVMTHFSHVRELRTDLAREAVRRVRDTGALLFAQAPVMAKVNDSAQAWADLWREELAAGIVPYYMFLPRDTGPQAYFEVPLVRAHEIFTGAYRQLSGLARTVRGPVMSTSPGKVVVDGVLGEGDVARLQLRFLQARDPSLVGRPFQARASATAAWLDELQLLDSTPGDLRAACLSAGAGIDEGE